MTQYFINSLFEPNHQSCIINIKESSLSTRDVWCGMPLGIFYFLEATKFGKAVYPFSLALFELTKCLWNWEKSFMSLFSHMFILKVATTVPLSCFEKRCLNWLYPSWSNIIVARFCSLVRWLVTLLIILMFSVRNNLI